ncbi:collagen alpha-1(I) chain-like [Choloepus didactylus]|uniref:collagen alpha-1(I) chain-like n=1 Tax=Choloepus didactylus TaxID=27675 RepID=UPI00189DA821|nr:collagen alpha-1(I) chain-like [Choloepus didactylus]
MLSSQKVRSHLSTAPDAGLPRTKADFPPCHPLAHLGSEGRGRVSACPLLHWLLSAFSCLTPTSPSRAEWKGGGGRRPRRRRRSGRGTSAFIAAGRAAVAAQSPSLTPFLWLHHVMEHSRNGPTFHPLQGADRRAQSPLPPRAARTPSLPSPAPGPSTVPGPAALCGRPSRASASARPPRAQSLLPGFLPPGFLRLLARARRAVPGRRRPGIPAALRPCGPAPPTPSPARPGTWQRPRALSAGARPSQEARAFHPGGPRPPTRTLRQQPPPLQSRRGIPRSCPRAAPRSPHQRAAEGVGEGRAGRGHEPPVSRGAERLAPGRPLTPARRPPPGLSPTPRRRDMREQRSPGRGPSGCAGRGFSASESQLADARAPAPAIGADVQGDAAHPLHPHLLRARAPRLSAPAAPGTGARGGQGPSPSGAAHLESLGWERGGRAGGERGAGERPGALVPAAAAAPRRGRARLKGGVCEHFLKDGGGRREGRDPGRRRGLGALCACLTQRGAAAGKGRRARAAARPPPARSGDGRAVPGSAAPNRSYEEERAARGGARREGGEPEKPVWSPPEGGSAARQGGRRQRGGRVQGREAEWGSRSDAVAYRADLATLGAESFPPGRGTALRPPNPHPTQPVLPSGQVGLGAQQRCHHDGVCARVPSSAPRLPSRPGCASRPRGPSSARTLPRGPRQVHSGARLGREVPEVQTARRGHRELQLVRPRPQRGGNTVPPRSGARGRESPRGGAGHWASFSAAGTPGAPGSLPPRLSGGDARAPSGGGGPRAAPGGLRPRGRAPGSSALPPAAGSGRSHRQTRGFDLA